MDYMKSLSPSSFELELRSLSADEKSGLQLKLMISFFTLQLQCRRDFELTQAREGGYTAGDRSARNMQLVLVGTLCWHVHFHCLHLSSMGSLGATHTIHSAWPISAMELPSQAFISVFLKVHSDAIAADPSNLDALTQLQTSQAWRRCSTLLKTTE